MAVVDRGNVPKSEIGVYWTLPRRIKGQFLITFPPVFALSGISLPEEYVSVAGLWGVAGDKPIAPVQNYYDSLANVPKVVLQNGEDGQVNAPVDVSGLYVRRTIVLEWDGYILFTFAGLTLVDQPFLQLSTEFNRYDMRDFFTGYRSTV